MGGWKKSEGPNGCPAGRYKDDSSSWHQPIGIGVVEARDSSWAPPTKWSTGAQAKATPPREPPSSPPFRDTVSRERGGALRHGAGRRGVRRLATVPSRADGFTWWLPVASDVDGTGTRRGWTCAFLGVLF